MQKTIIILITIIVSFFILNSLSNASLYRAAKKPFSSEDNIKTFIVNPGENVKQVAKNLKEQKLINSSSVFVRYAKKMKADKKIKSGTYVLNTNMSIHDILTILISGTREEVWITIPEGWRISQIAQYLEEQGLVKAGEFKKRAKVKYFSSYAFLVGLGSNTSLEGYLFPDTYRIFVDSSSDEIIEKMLNNFSNKITPEIMNQANKMGFSLHEFITLASIVEKESAHSQDIRKISSVYHNRLKDHMPLQSDATITYITGRPDSRPTYEETRIRSPYNTYLNYGLPPGPIGNPGIEAIQATLNPEDTNYYFFISKNGRAYFASTYEEHMENIKKYLGD